MTTKLTAHEVFNPKFFDKNGNLKMNSWQPDSENPSTPNNVAAIMADQLGLDFRPYLNIAHLNANKHLKNGGKYMTNEGDAEKYKQELKEASCLDAMKMRLGFKRSSNRFSHDEVNAVCAGSFYFLVSLLKYTPMLGIDEEDARLHDINLYKLPENSKQTFYRPYDVGAEVKYCKRHFREAYQGGEQKELLWQIALFCKNACKDPIGETSGKQQAWLRLNGLRMMADFEVCTMVLPEEDGWIDVFATYYPEEDHPINIMARELYGDR